MSYGSASQGYFWWPGIQTFLHGAFTFTHGISPSLCQLYIAPQTYWPAMVGNLTVNYLPGGDTRTFTDCILDFVSIERGDDGRQTWGLHILDRRWKWKDCGRISGNYNIRRGQGDGKNSIWLPSLKKLKELMELCLTAMGEGTYGFDVAQVDDDVYPEVEWDYDNPATALLQLCDQYGYRVILTLENQVLIAAANEGAYLPDATYLSGATTIDPPNTPSAVVAVMGRTQIQYDFPLEAVAEDVNGVVANIADMGYANGPWKAGDLVDFSRLEPAARPFAMKSLFRWYRILPPFMFRGLSDSMGSNVQITDRMHVLPILDVQVDESPETPDAPPKPLAAIVYGVWMTQSQHTSVEMVTTPGSPAAKLNEQLPDSSQGTVKYPYEFEIDADEGIVKFGEPVYLPIPDSDVIMAASLFLRTSVNVRDRKTMGFLRAEESHGMANAMLPTQPRYEKHDEIANKVAYRFSKSGTPVSYDSPNYNDVVAAADYYIDAMVEKLTIENPQSYEYPGLVFIELDGAIQQLEWNVGEDGKATTKANRCKEDLVNTPSYDEAKKAALLQLALADSGKTSRVKQQNAAQNLTVS